MANWGVGRVATALIVLALSLVLPGIATAAAPLGVITKYRAGLEGLPGHCPGAATTGPSGNLWFLDTCAAAIGYFDPTTRAVTEYPTGTSQLGGDITYGPRNNLWFSVGLSGRPGIQGAIGELDPRTGEISMHSVGLRHGSSVGGIATGPEGNLWFTNSESYTGANDATIGKLDTGTGLITEYRTGLTPKAEPSAIAAGPDGSLWFSDAISPILSGPSLGRIEPSTGGIIGYGLSAFQWRGFAPGPDGHLWLTGSTIGTGNAVIAQLDPRTGKLAEYSRGLQPDNELGGIATGPDGKLWFTVSGGSRSPRSPPAIGRLDPRTGRIDEYACGLSGDDSPTDLIAGTDGNMWVTITESFFLRFSSIGRIGTRPFRESLRLGRPVIDRKQNDTGTIAARVSGPGTVEVRSGGLYTESERVPGCGGGRVVLELRGNTQTFARVISSGSATINATVTYRPKGLTHPATRRKPIRRHVTFTFRHRLRHRR
jgi:virginiamycin B lyase